MMWHTIAPGTPCTALCFRKLVLATSSCSVWFPSCAAHGLQVNLVVLHEAFSPSTPRLLREAAALLSPQSVAMPVQQAEHVTPITGNSSSSGTDTGPKALFASILQLANSGGSSLGGCCKHTGRAQMHLSRAGHPHH